MLFLVSFFGISLIGLPIYCIPPLPPQPPFGLLALTCMAFNSTLMGVFGRFLNPSSLEYPHASLVHKQIFFPIFSRRVGFISFKVIVLVA